MLDLVNIWILSTVCLKKCELICVRYLAHEHRREVYLGKNAFFCCNSRFLEGVDIVWEPEGVFKSWLTERMT